MSVPCATSNLKPVGGDAVPIPTKPVLLICILCALLVSKEIGWLLYVPIRASEFCAYASNLTPFVVSLKCSVGEFACIALKSWPLVTVSEAVIVVPEIAAPENASPSLTNLFHAVQDVLL